MNSVLQLLNYAPPYGGNFMASIRNLAEALRQKGMQTVFVLPPRARDRDWAHALQTDGYPVYFLPGGTFAAAKLLRRCIRRHGVRLVHSHFIDSCAYLPLRLATLFRHIPHIFHAHSLPKYTAGFKTNLRRRLLHADKILCVSDAVRKAYAALGFPNCVTVPNGIDFDRLHTAEPFPKPSPCILMFGYDFQIKGIDTALHALDFFDPTHRYTLRICVANHMDRAVEFLRQNFGGIPEWVQLLEPRSDVGTYFQSADIFLSASRTEGMPYAVLEAAYCGLPLVLSSIEPHKELRLPQAEFFVPDDQKALFQAVCRAQGVPRGINTRFVREKFALQTWTECVLAQFPSIPGRKEESHEQQHKHEN